MLNSVEQLLLLAFFAALLVDGNAFDSIVLRYDSDRVDEMPPVRLQDMRGSQQGKHLSRQSFSATDCTRTLVLRAAAASCGAATPWL